MITVRMTGGLGNQMFQYAAARRLALKHDTEVCLDLDWYAQSGPVSFELNHLAIHPPVVMDSRHALKLRLIRTLAEQFPNLSRRFAALYTEPHYEFSPEILELPRHTFLSGFFESEQNFADVRGQIRAEFRPRDGALIKRLKAAVDSLRGFDRELVAVHVRRGDFRVFLEGRLLVPPEIISEAMAQFPGRDFLVFSDEMDWCREFIQGPSVMYSPFETTIEDLFAMSICDHHVIGASTFGWWAAWLNPNPSKVVVETQADRTSTYRAFPER